MSAPEILPFAGRFVGVVENGRVLARFERDMYYDAAEALARAFLRGLLIGRGWRKWWTSGCEGSPELIPPEEYERRIMEPFAREDQARLQTRATTSEVEP